MCKTVINDVPGLVTTWWDEDLEALRIKWFSEYAEGSAVTDAVELAMRYVNEHGRKDHERRHSYLCQQSN